MWFLEEAVAWGVSLDWPKILRWIKELGDFKDLMILVITSITAIALVFIKRNLKKAVKEIRHEVGLIQKGLEDGGREFRGEMTKALGDIDSAMARLKISMDATLDRADMAGDALAKKVDFVKKEIEILIEDAFLRAGNGGTPVADRGAVVKIDRWDELKALWDTTKREVDGRIREVIGHLTDGRRRRRYAENLDKRDYESVILRLYEDNWIDDDASNALLEMNLLFNSRRSRKRPVRDEELDQFKAWREQWLMASQVVPAAAAE